MAALVAVNVLANTTNAPVLRTTNNWGVTSYSTNAPGARTTNNWGVIHYTTNGPSARTTNSWGVITYSTNEPGAIPDLRVIISTNFVGYLITNTSTAGGPGAYDGTYLPSTNFNLIANLVTQPACALYYCSSNSGVYLWGEKHLNVYYWYFGQSHDDTNSYRLYGTTVYSNVPPSFAATFTGTNRIYPTAIFGSTNYVPRFNTGLTTNIPTGRTNY